MTNGCWLTQPATPLGGSWTLVVGHWELGVLVTPSTLGVQSMGVSPKTEGLDSYGAMDNDSYSKRAVIPLPYKFQPDPYNADDCPWWTRPDQRKRD